MEQVAAYFNNKFDKTKIAPTGTQLLAYAAANNLKNVRPAEVYKFLREQLPEIGPFSRKDRTKHYQTIGVPRQGLYFIDYGEFHKNWSKFNEGCTGFLIAVENLTNRLFVLPTKGKDTKQWLSSIEKFVEVTRDVRIIFSDRDSVALSKKFRGEIEREYNIKWHFLKKGNKSYLAERYIGFVKTKLSQALEKNGQNTRKWIDFVSPLCESYNAEKIAGTSYVRKTVHAKNFDHFVGQLLGLGKDPELEYNGFKVGPFLNENWNKKIFKFSLGDKVRLARTANWKDASEKAGVFDKVSSRGAYGKKEFTVGSRQLRTNKLRNMLVPVYSLTELGDSQHFYENELVKISYATDVEPEASTPSSSSSL